jgi:drug/metabolite transporter (DMT)-like permease
MRVIGNAAIMLAGSILMLGIVLAVGILFLAALAIVLLRRITAGRNMPPALPQTTA